MKSQEIIQNLGLIKHIQGGYFKQIYLSPIIHNNRKQMTTIYFMLNKQSPIDHWHINKSDIVHFHHLGGAFQYHVIFPQDGHLESYVLGKDIAKGELLQLMVPKNTWKVCYLLEGQYGLISQAVAPGFEYEDMSLIEQQKLMQLFPQHKDVITFIQKKSKNINQKPQ